MKLRLHWAEKYEVVREYPSFEIDSKEVPELELEMLQVYSAESPAEQASALDALEYKMHQTQIDGGESIFEMFGPHDHSKFEESKIYSVSDEIGSLVIAGEEE
jgi:hypothetical protein